MIGNLTLRTKLFVLLAPLIIVLLIYASMLVHADWSATYKARQVTENMSLIGQANALVHELQKERGMTAGFLASKGKVFNAELMAQRQKSDTELQQLRQYVDDTPALLQSDYIKKDWVRIEQLIAQLSERRSRISSLQLSLPDALRFYTETIHQLLAINISVIAENTNTQLSTDLTAYYQFLQAKERAGIERAMLNSAFSAQSISPDGFLQALRIIAEQNQFLQLYKEMGSSRQNELLKQVLADPVIAQVDIYRQEFLSHQFQRDPKQWFALATQRIDLFKQLQDQLNRDIMEHADAVYQTSQKSLYLVSILTVLVLIGGFGFLFVMVSGISRHARAVTETVNRVAQTRDLALRIPVQGQDEFAQIARAFNQLLTSFYQAIHEINHASNELATTAGETTSAVRQNAVLVDAQKMEVLQTIAAIEQMSTSINDVAHHVTQTSQAATDTDRQVTQIANLIQRSDQSIADVASSLLQMAENVKELNDNSDQINEVINVIKSIAEQTNLLALNAAIEAARAGELGRGFAVVADEVRSLAQRTQQSTGEIERIISTFQKNAASVYSDMTLSKSNAERSVQQSSEVQRALKQVLVAVSDIRDRSVQIATAAEEQASVSSAISKSVSRIGESANASVESSQLLVHSASVQSALARELQESAQEFTA